jgi:hypothetical protein
VVCSSRTPLPQWDCVHAQPHQACAVAIADLNAQRVHAACMLWPLQKGLYDGVNGVAQLLHEIDTAAPSVHGVDVSQVSNRPRVLVGLAQSWPI